MQLQQYGRQHKWQQQLGNRRGRSAARQWQSITALLLRGKPLSVTHCDSKLTFLLVLLCESLDLLSSRGWPCVLCRLVRGDAGHLLLCANPLWGHRRAMLLQVTAGAETQERHSAVKQLRANWMRKQLLEATDQQGLNGLLMPDKEDQLLGCQT